MTQCDSDIGRAGGIEANGPTPDDALSFYAGTVMHARLNPFGHRFAYRVYSILIDIDRLDEAARVSPLFGINRAGLMSFHERDHAGTGKQSLRAFVESQLADAGLSEPPGRILLNCYPRVLGFVFNPLSVYYVYGGHGGRLIALVYEVRNTFGQRHTYVAALRDGEASDAGIRQSRTKIFHVSPFIPMGAVYHFRVLPPGRTLRTRILETLGGKPVLTATFAGTYRKASTGSILAQAISMPFLTLKVVAGIHWEALKLWVKGAKYHPIPEPPEPVSYGDPLVQDGDGVSLSPNIRSVR